MIEERKLKEIEKMLEKHGIRDYNITIKDGEVFIEFFKRVTSQPSCELEEDIYEELVKRFTKEENERKRIK